MAEELKLSGKTVQCSVCTNKTALEEDIGGVTSWLCVNCGYTSNTMFTSDSVEFKSTPLAIMNMKHWDEEKQLMWIPTVINMPSRGLIMPEKHGKQVIWTCILMVDIPAEEQHNYPITEQPGKFYKRKLDVNQTLKYTKFYDAIKSLGAIIELDELEETIKEERFDA